MSKKQFILNYIQRNGSTKNASKAWERSQRRIKGATIRANKLKSKKLQTTTVNMSEIANDPTMNMSAEYWLNKKKNI